jgi:hypothetical protein
MITQTRQHFTIPTVQLIVWSRRFACIMLRDAIGTQTNALHHNDQWPRRRDASAATACTMRHPALSDALNTSTDRRCA